MLRNFGVNKRLINGKNRNCPSMFYSSVYDHDHDRDHGRAHDRVSASGRASDDRVLPSVHDDPACAYVHVYAHHCDDDYILAHVYVHASLLLSISANVNDYANADVSCHDCVHVHVHDDYDYHDHDYTSSYFIF